MQYNDAGSCVLFFLFQSFSRSQSVLVTPLTRPNLNPPSYFIATLLCIALPRLYKSTGCQRMYRNAISDAYINRYKRMTITNRRKLTDKEQKIAARIHSLWLAKKEREGVTQRDMAKELGWTVGTAGQYMLGRIPLNANAISRFAKYLGVSPYDIDPSLAENFIVPPDDLIDVEQQLKAMAPDDLRRLIGDLSRRLPQQDLLRLVALLADRATERR